MKLSLRSVVAGASALVITGGVLAATVGTAAGATPPPWEPDPNALGSLTFYNSSGAVVTGGSNLNHLFDYAEASTTDATGGLKASLIFANPQPSTPTGSFFSASDGELAAAFPNSAAPAPLNTTPNPVMTVGASGANLTNFIASATPNTVAGFQNVYQIRVVTSGAGGVGTGTSHYWEDDISVNPSAGTWTTVFPGVVAATSTTLTASPSPALTTDSVTLTATETPATAGSVDFKDGATDLGSSTVNGSGVATLTHTFATSGSQSLTATFAPTDTADFSGSTGSATLQVNVPSTPTTTSLTVSQDGFAGDDVSLSSTVVEGPVSPAPGTPVEAGTVSWFDNGSSTPLNGSPVTPNASGVATFDIPAGLASGAHSIVAKFTPTDVTQFEASSSAAQPFFLNTKAAAGKPCAQTGSVCTDTQNIQTTVPIGTLVINTPYGSNNPLTLPDMSLNSTGTEYTTSGAFDCIEVTDTTSGATPWTAQALAQPLTDATPPSPLPASAVTTINPENLGLTGLTQPAPGTDGAACPDFQSYTGGIARTDNPAAAAVPPTDGGSLGLGGATPHTFAVGSGGDGTATIDGTLSLTAPTSTASGLYKGTIVFTVAD
jgi:hypothetical protein